MLLAELSLSDGLKREAVKLARQAMDLDDLDWVVKRAQAVLESAGER